MPGYSALKRLGEQLMRRSESDPRLARAVAQGYDLLNPVVHGTNSTGLIDKPRAFYATSYPEHAMEYTGGGAGSGVGANGVLIPALLRGQVNNTELSAFQDVSTRDLNWLRQLGVAEPEALRQAARESNIQRLSANPRRQAGLKEGLVPDPVFGEVLVKPGDEYDYDMWLTTVLNSLGDELGQATTTPLIRFKHPYAGNTKTGDSILVSNPGLARSPWAEFSERNLGKPGLGLARGGLAQCTKCKA